VRFQVDVDGSLMLVIKDVEKQIIDAGNDAVARTTDELKALAKQAVGSALGSKVGNTVTTRKYNYLDPAVGVAQVAGWFYSRWWRKAAGGVVGSANSAAVRGQKAPLAANDVLFGHTQDLTIRPAKSDGWLLIPLIARRLLKRNPVQFGRAGVQMVPTGSHQGKYAFSGSGVLVVQGGGVRGGARKRNKGLPVALLRRSVFVRHHLDLRPVSAFAETRLAERVVLALAERGLN